MKERERRGHRDRERCEQAGTASNSLFSCSQVCPRGEPACSFLSSAGRVRVALLSDESADSAGLLNAINGANENENLPPVASDSIGLQRQNSTEEKSS